MGNRGIHMIYKDESRELEACFFFTQKIIYFIVKEDFLKEVMLKLNFSRMNKSWQTEEGGKGHSG